MVPDCGQIADGDVIPTETYSDSSCISCVRMTAHGSV